MFVGIEQKLAFSDMGLEWTEPRIAFILDRPQRHREKGTCGNLRIHGTTDIYNSV